MRLETPTTKDTKTSGTTSNLRRERKILPMGSIFLSLLKLLVVPLVFVSLVVGVSNLTSDKQLLSISSKAIALYLFTTALAIISALFVSSFFEMANGVSMVSNSSFEQDAIPSLKILL